MLYSFYFSLGSFNFLQDILDYRYMCAVLFCIARLTNWLCTGLAIIILIVRMLKAISVK